MSRLVVVAFLLCACSSNRADEPRPDAQADTAHDEVADWDAIPNDAALEPPRDAPRSCPWVEDAGPGVETGLSIPSWCEPTTSNSAECPPTKPTGGEPCSRDALVCRYGLEAGLAHIAYCSAGKWTVPYARCSSDCPALDGGTWSVPTAPACGSAPDIACAEDDRITDYERASRRFRQFADCCGGLNENSLTARFEDGCMRSIEIARADPSADAFVSCLTHLLAGRRFACAPTSCVEIEWSTVK